MLTGDLVYPLKWVSEKGDGWFIEKQQNSTRWISFIGNKMNSTWTELSIEIDANGYPIVRLEQKEDRLSLRLTQFIAFMESDVKFKKLPGLWKTKKGRTPQRILYCFNRSFRFETNFKIRKAFSESLKICCQCL